MEVLKAGAQKLGINFSSRQLEQYRIYYEELIDWNKKVNLTSITGYEEVQIKHFLDSLTVTLAMKPQHGDKPLTVIDVGAGAGFPGLPLKITFPDMKLTLLEATVKKTKFLQTVIELLELRDAEIVSGRAEEAGHSPQYRERFDLVLSRAVAALPALAELTLPFCNIGGCVIAQKKGEIKAEVERARKAIDVLGGALREVKPVDLEELNDERYLVVIDKIRTSPDAYPRRAGMPVKRPIIS